MHKFSNKILVSYLFDIICFNKLHGTVIHVDADCEKTVRGRNSAWY